MLLSNSWRMCPSLSPPLCFTLDTFYGCVFKPTNIFFCYPIRSRVHLKYCSFCASKSFLAVFIAATSLRNVLESGTVITMV